MEKKVFLDSGVMISLGKIHKFCGSDTKKLSNMSEIHKILQNDSINILDKDVKNLCILYSDIINGNVKACVPPFVYKEIAVDAKNASAKLTSDFFYNTNCYLAIPDEESGYDVVLALKTILYSNKLQEIDVPDSSDPSIKYGLGADIHTYTGQEPVDVNNEDRWIISQIQAMSELGDEKIAFIPGKVALWNKVAMDAKVVKMYEAVEFARDDYDFALNYATSEFGLTEEDILTQNSQNMYLFLQENEKDYGREYTTDRIRTYAVKNESAYRDARAMDEVIHRINDSLSGVRVVTAGSKELSQILSGSAKNQDFDSSMGFVM